MEFSCHTWAFNDLPLGEALATIARLGFRYVDIGTGPHLNIVRAARDPRGAAAEIRRDLELFNLKLADVYLMLPRISLADEEKRRRDIDLFRAMLPFVLALETPGVTLSPGLRPPPQPIKPPSEDAGSSDSADDENGEDYADDDADDEEEEPEDPLQAALNRAIDALKEMTAAAAAATPATHLRVSIEPHMDSIAAGPDTALKLINAVPDLELTLDWAHMICQDVFHEDIAALVPHARHIQIRQAARAQLQTPFERGRIDVERVVESLRAADYDGVVCVEYMQTEGWHGMIKVNAIQEAMMMRDALRDARDA